VKLRRARDEVSSICTHDHRSRGHGATPERAVHRRPRAIEHGREADCRAGSGALSRAARRRFAIKLYVPVLKLDYGRAITESRTICEHLLARPEA
jgi:hypothetical protein